MKFHRYRSVIFALFLILSSRGSAHAEALPAKEPIVVNGDHVEYLQEQKKVIGTGNISITYKDIVLTCEKVSVNLQTHDAEAEGNVNITQKDAYFIGDKIIYNFEKRSAVIDYGYINANPFFGRAENMTKEAGKDEFSLNNGSVTTCDYDKPHYRIQAERVKIYLDDKVEANNIIFLRMHNLFRGKRRVGIKFINGRPLTLLIDFMDKNQAFRIASSCSSIS